jgi:hypothetical protein
MWQIMWMLSLLPDWFWHLLTIGGVLAVFAAVVLKRIPFVSQYRLPLQWGGVAALLYGWKAVLPTKLNGKPVLKN